MRNFLIQRRHSWHVSSSSSYAKSDSKSKRRRYSLASNIGSDYSKYSNRNGFSRRHSLPNMHLHRRQPMQINDVIVEEDSSTVDEEDETRHRTMKFDTAIKGDHLVKLIVLTLFVCIVTVSAVSYSLYNILQKRLRL